MRVLMEISKSLTKIVVLSGGVQFSKIYIPNQWSLSKIGVFMCYLADFAIWVFAFEDQSLWGKWVLCFISRGGSDFRHTEIGYGILHLILFVMETLTTSAQPIQSEAFNYNGAYMQQSLLFSDSLKDLKNLRVQLYSAAEYFELSYTNYEQKLIVIETLKDYATRALVNTVDHLGSVTYKVTDLLDKVVDEVCGTQLRVSCIEQRIRTCQEYIDREGLSQQELVINTPKYQKRYILPAGKTAPGANRSLNDQDVWHQYRNAVKATVRATLSSSVSKGRHPSPSSRASQRAVIFSLAATMPKKELDKRTLSPYRFPFSHARSVSSRPVTPVSSRPTTPTSSRPPNPSSSGIRKQNTSEPQKSVSKSSCAERDSSKDSEEYPSKSKRLLKALLSRRRTKRDDMLYTYLDEY